MIATHEFTGVGTTWYVSSEVTGSSGSGTISDPWSLEYAGEGADDQIQPGGRVLLRGQRPGGPFIENYQPYTIGGQSRGTGYEISVSGKATKPITWASYPGEVVTFADYIDTSDGWTKVTTREDGSSFPITANVYESNFTVAGNVHAVHAYFRHNDRFFVIGALRGPTGAGPYTTHTQIAALYADTSRFRMDGAFYPGPCIIRLGNGKLRVRLDECVTEGHEYGNGTDNPFFGETTQIYPASTDPEDVDLRIYRQDDCGLLITGSFNIVEDMFFDGFPRACIKDSGDNNIIRRNSGRSPYFAISIANVDGHAAGWYYDNNFDGMLDFNKSPFTRGDVKAGVELLTLNRSQAFTVDNDSVGGRAWGNTFEHFYDGSAFGAPGWKIGGSAYPIDDTTILSAADLEALRWSKKNNWNEMWDDGLQLYSSAEGLDFGYNIFRGAGLTRDGAASENDHGADVPRMHHNIIDAYNHRLLWNRAGRDLEALIYGEDQSTLAAGITTDATTFTVATGEGALFSAVGAGRKMTLIESVAPYCRETVLVTDITGDVFTVTRAQTPTAGTRPDTAVAFSSGSLIVDTVRDARFSEEGRIYAPGMNAHSEPTGAQYRYPWHFYHNTLIMGENVAGTIGTYIPIMMFGNEATLGPEGNPKNLAFNNLIIVGGTLQATGALPRLAYLSASRIYTVRGSNIHDGNVYVSLTTAVILMQQMRDSLNTNYDNIVDTIKEFRSAQLRTDAETYANYAPGMESTGRAYISTVADQVDANYRPLDERLLTGAIELTQFGALPGIENHQTWRGAMGPIE